jgi:hypothetical protein
LKKNKLDFDKDIKIGDTMDIILEISGLKIMKSSFSTNIILRQIRKHPNITKRTHLPSEYLFLDEFSKVNNVLDDGSLDSQTDVDVLIHKKVDIKNIEKDDDDTKEHNDNMEMVKNVMENILEDSSKEERKIIDSDSEIEEIFSKKDKILNKLENQNSILDSINNISDVAISKKKTTKKNTTPKFSNDQLHKNI